MGAFLGCGGRRRVDLWGWVRFCGGWAGLLGVFGRVRSLGDVWNLWETFSYGLFGWVWAGSAELGEGVDAGESGVMLL